MNVGIYKEPWGADFGGSECLVAVIAEALEGLHRVEIVHHNPGLSAARLASFTGTTLRGVSLRCIPRFGLPGEHSPWRRYRAAERWHADVSASYDLLISVVHQAPPICHAPRGVLIGLFPFGTRPVWGSFSRPPSEAPSAGWTDLPRRVYDLRDWGRRLAGYQRAVSISQYSQLWMQRRWGVDSEVIYPPVEHRSWPEAEKESLILSVGRFTTARPTKAQLAMVSALEGIEPASRGGWRYACVGSLGDRPEDRELFEDVRRAGAKRQCHVAANLDRRQLKQLYGRAKVFWHAAGYGADAAAHPGDVEHFGVATVEAMAAGCVPLVIDRGGQREIVEHGVNGFRWNTLPELRDYTSLVIGDESLRARMSAAARVRAEAFSREVFIDRFLALLRPLLA